MSHVDDGTLHAYLDAELSPAERSQVEVHLSGCATCRAQLDEERGLRERASQLLGLAQPVVRAAPALDRLRRPRLTWRLRLPVAWAATVVLAVGLGYYAGRLTPLDAPAPPAPGALADRSAVPTPEPAAPSATRRVATREAARPAVRDVGRTDAVNQLVSKVAERADTTAAAPGRRPAPADAAPAAAGALAQPSQARAEEAAEQEHASLTTDAARRILGADPVAVPDLPVRTIRQSGDAAVVVVQALDSTRVVQLFQRRPEADRGERRREAAAAPQTRDAASERLARFVGTLRVEIAGPLPADSLSRLLARVRPIP